MKKVKDAYNIYDEMLKELLETNHLEKKHIYLIMATVAMSLHRLDLAEIYIAKGKDYNTTTKELLEAFQSPSPCWFLWLD